MTDPTQRPTPEAAPDLLEMARSEYALLGATNIMAAEPGYCVQRRSVLKSLIEEEEARRAEDAATLAALREELLSERNHAAELLRALRMSLHRHHICYCEGCEEARRLVNTLQPRSATGTEDAP